MSTIERKVQIHDPQAAWMAAEEKTVYDQYQNFALADSMAEVRSTKFDRQGCPSM